MSENQKIIIECSCSKIEMPLEEFQKKVAEWMKPFGPNFSMMPSVEWQCMKCFQGCTLVVKKDETNSS